MRKKNLVCLLIGLLIIILIAVGIYLAKTHNTGLIKQSKEAAVYQDGNLSYCTRINGNRFQVYKAGQWEDMLIKGVNIGMARPGTWPGEAAISESEYYRWFKYIGEMGANAIVGIDIDYENITVGGGGAMLMVSVTGTAVKVEG